MKRLKKDGGRRAALPPEVHADLVETLFGTVGSLVSGIFGGLLVPIIAWSRTQDPIYLFSSLVMLALAGLRLEVLRRHRRANAIERRAEAKYWETLYGVGAVGFMLAVGLTAALLVGRAHDDIALLYGVLIAVGCVGAVAGRNAARPLIVYGQVGALCLPLAISFMANRSP